MREQTDQRRHVVTNRNSPPAILLRESFREDGKVRKRTLANLSMRWPATLVEGLNVLLKGGRAVARLEDAFHIARSRPHAPVAPLLQDSFFNACVSGETGAFNRPTNASMRLCRNRSDCCPRKAFFCLAWRYMHAEHSMIPASMRCR